MPMCFSFFYLCQHLKPIENTGSRFSMYAEISILLRNSGSKSCFFQQALFKHLK